MLSKDDLTDVELYPLTGLNHIGKLIPQISLERNLNLSADFGAPTHTLLMGHNA